MAATSKDEHPGTDQLIPDVTGWAGISGARSETGGLGQNVVTAVGELAQLFDGFDHNGASGCQRDIGVERFA
jgi:hypothetical protein